MGNVVFVIHRPTKQVVASGVRTALAVSSQSELSEALAGKASIAQGAKADTAVQPEALAAVAISGAYADLAGLPSIPSTPGSIGAATAAQGAKADTAVQPGELASVATSGSYADLSSKPLIPAVPGDIGAATAAQGAKADTAVQPADLSGGLAGKVDKDGLKGLSDQNYTAAEKAKLAGIEGPQFKGLHASLAALQSAHPSAAAGNYADVDSGAGADVARYIWDVSDSKWVIQSGASGSMTAAQIKTAYESNPDTNAFSDAEQSKLGAIAPGATANATDAQLRDRSTHTGTQAASTISDLAVAVRGVVMTGVSFATATAGLATDNLLVFLGKLQAQITGLVTTVAGKQDTLVSGTTLKTVNGSSLLGAGDLAIAGGGASLPVIRAITANETLGLTSINTFGVNATTSNYVSTIPAQATVAWTSDAELHFLPSDTGDITITAAAGVSLNGVVACSLTLSTQNGAATLKRTGADSWWLGGVVGTTAEQRAALGLGEISGINQLINGDFSINQRKFAGGALAAGSYGHDRWGAYNGGANWSVSAGVVTLTSGVMCQVIESPGLAGSQITISVEDPGGTIEVTIGNNAGADSATGNITAGSGRRSVTLTVPAGVTGDLKVRLAATAVTFKRVKVELGSAASAWQPTDRSVENQKAMRYFYAINNTAGSNAMVLLAQGVNSVGIAIGLSPFLYPVVMRAAPAVVVSGVTLMKSDGNVYTVDATLNAFTAMGTSNGKINLQLTFGAEGAVPNPTGLVLRSTSSYIRLDAELSCTD